MATHQGPTQQFQYLWQYAETNAKDVMQYIQQDICLCYSGMSGTALATALFVKLNQAGFKYKVGMLFVRKEDEPSNSGNKIHFHDAGENHSVEAPPLYIFVDDQVGSGRTFMRVEQGLKDVWRRLPYGVKEKWEKREITYACLKGSGLHVIAPCVPEDAAKAYPFAQNIQPLRTMECVRNKTLYRY